MHNATVEHNSSLLFTSGKILMQVFTTEFVSAVKAKLESLQDGFYLTRDQLCVSLNVPSECAGVITMLLATPEFSCFEAVKSRGIRRRKVAPLAA